MALFSIKKSMFLLRFQTIGIKSIKKQSNSVLKNKIAIVTGGISGIGLEITKLLLQNGINGITIGDIKKERNSTSLRKLINHYGEDRLILMDIDVSKFKQVDQLFKTTINTFGAVDIVINNAGILNDKNWESQLSTNLIGCISGTTLGMHYMSKTCSGKGGLIINIASTMGLNPSRSLPIYTMTQFGIVGFSRAIGNDIHYQRTGVKVVVLCPGLTDTKLLRQATYHALNEKFAKEYKEEFNNTIVQTPRAVASALLDIIDYCESGSVWVVENNNKPFEVGFQFIKDEDDKIVFQQ